MATWIIIAFVLICLGMGIYPILQLAPNDRQKKYKSYAKPHLVRVIVLM